jgi:hypothetical protein
VGKPINPAHLRRRSFKPILERAGLPDTTFHAATRHTCCSLLLMQGVNPRAVSLQLGHTSVAFTLQRYAHFVPGFGDNGAMDLALLEDHISSSNGQERGTRASLHSLEEGVGLGGTSYTLLAPQKPSMSLILVSTTSPK